MGSASTNTQAGVAVTSVRIEREKLAAFKQVAAANRRTVSDHLRWLIDREIAESAEPEPTEAAA